MGEQIRMNQETKEKELKRIKKNIDEAYNYFNENYEYWHKMHKFIFSTAISDEDKKKLDQLQKPQLEFNELETYISKFRSALANQLPAIEVTPDIEANLTPELTDFIEGHMRHIFYEANKDQCEYEVYSRTLAGGFDVLKIWTEYANEKSFNQVIKFGRVFDPTLCGFDPKAQKSHKGDGDFCFELFPMNIDDFKKEFKHIDTSSITYNKSCSPYLNSFSWSYKNQSNIEVILVADYYETKKTKKKLFLLSNGKSVTEDRYNDVLEKAALSGFLSEIPQIIDERETEITSVISYRLIKDQLLSKEETDFRHLPLVFVDGCSVTYKDSASGSVRQKVKSCIHNAIGAQRLKNFAGQTLAGDLENMRQSQIMVPIEGLPNQEEYLEAYRNPQLLSALAYRQFKDNDPNVRLDPPQIIARPPIPQEITSTFHGMDATLQTILGDRTASLGTASGQYNKFNMSGVAIETAEILSNDIAKPYVINLMASLSRVAEIFVDLIPKFYSTPRTIPIVDSTGKKQYIRVNQQQGIELYYDTNVFNVKVTAGESDLLQKSRSLETLASSIQSLPLLGQILNTPDGIAIYLDNLDIRGVDKLKAISKQYFEQQAKNQQQQQILESQQLQNNPMYIEAQTNRAKLILDTKQKQTENQLQAAELRIKQEKVENDRAKLLTNLESDKIKLIDHLDRSFAEKARAGVDLAIKAADMQHRHQKDIVNLSKKGFN